MIKKIKTLEPLNDKTYSLCSVYSLINAIRIYYLNSKAQCLNFSIKNLLDSLNNICKCKNNLDGLLDFSYNFMLFKQNYKYLNLTLESAKKQSINLEKYKVDNLLYLLNNEAPSNLLSYENEFIQLIKQSKIYVNNLYGKYIKLNAKILKTTNVNITMNKIVGTIDGGAPVIIAYNNTFLFNKKFTRIKNMNEKRFKRLLRIFDFLSCNHMAVIYGYKLSKDNQVQGFYIQDNYGNKQFENGSYFLDANYFKHFMSYCVFLGG